MKRTEKQEEEEEDEEMKEGNIGIINSHANICLKNKRLERVTRRKVNEEPKQTKRIEIKSTESNEKNGIVL